MHYVSVKEILEDAIEKNFDAIMDLKMESHVNQIEYEKKIKEHKENRKEKLKKAKEDFKNEKKLKIKTLELQAKELEIEKQEFIDNQIRLEKDNIDRMKKYCEKKEELYDEGNKIVDQLKNTDPNSTKDASIFSEVKDRINEVMGITKDIHTTRKVLSWGEKVFVACVNKIAKFLKKDKFIEEFNKINKTVTKVTKTIGQERTKTMLKPEKIDRLNEINSMLEYVSLDNSEKAKVKTIRITNFFAKLAKPFRLFLRKKEKLTFKDKTFAKEKNKSFITQNFKRKIKVAQWPEVGKSVKKVSKNLKNN